MRVVLETNFPNLKFFNRGKVRDIYDLGDYFLMISTDRLSAFDVVMNQGIPYKGMILTKISEFWSKHFGDIIDNHLVSTNINDFPTECHEYADILEGRSMLVKKAKVIKLECIVRGYITGSGLKDYKNTGKICGIELPQGLVESEKLPEPIFTPSTKADIGDHDENVSREQAVKIVGEKTYDTLKEKTLQLYKSASDYAFSKSIIIADTKLEFGEYNGKVILIDEAFTPDSSRFWPKDSYEKGKVQQSYDKQYVRDYLTSIGFRKQPPAPDLPEDVILNTSSKYKEALYQITGERID